jgi:hypothetical protein
MGPFAVAAVTELAQPTAAITTTAYIIAFIFIRYVLQGGCAAWGNGNPPNGLIGNSLKTPGIIGCREKKVLDM